MGLSRALDAPFTQDRDRVDREAGRLVGTALQELRGGVLAGPGDLPSAAARPTANRRRSRREGELVTYTTVWVPRPGLEPPYILGAGRPAARACSCSPTCATFPSDARVPVPVRIVMAPEADAVPPFWFEPMEAR